MDEAKASFVSLGQSEGDNLKDGMCAPMKKVIRQNMLRNGNQTTGMRSLIKYRFKDLAASVLYSFAICMFEVKVNAVTACFREVGTHSSLSLNDTFSE